MPNNFFKHLISLIRIDSPTGYLLSFFPASFGLMLAYEKDSDLAYLPIFFLCSILIRSSGCIINDLLDADLDNHVERTKNRPITNGYISEFQALMLLATLTIPSLLILLSLKKTAIYIGMITAVMICIYPLMKRFTYFPQIFLGLTFNMGCLIGYASIKDNISTNAIIMYIACGFWTVAYDTIYAFMDIEDDKKIGIKSTAIFFEYRSYNMMITICYAIFLCLFIFALGDLSIPSIFIMFLNIAIITWIVTFLNIKDSKNCLTRFKSNNYIGFLLFLSMLLEKL